VTHVDTSTAVVAPLQQVAAILRAANPNIVICADSVAGLGGETLRMSEWDIDYVMTGSQKAIGVPAGLSISVARPRALAAAKNRKTPVRFTYVSWAKWTPVMQSYMDEKVSYFATPAVGLVFALETGLRIHLANGGSEARFREHALVAGAFRAALAALGLRTVASTPALSAATLTGIYYPEGINGDTLRAAIKTHGAIVAGGLHKLIGPRYFRVGHMGYSVYGGRVEHVLRAVNAIEKALAEQGHKLQPGAATAAFEAHVKKAAL
jgi:alanine-glyoxylate transaminase/serine-glyoxylate transaminase/serine-pyruvate transaminase